MKGSAGFRLALVGLGLATAGGVVIFTACSGGYNPGQLPQGLSSGGPLNDSGITFYGDAGAPCQAPAGELPNAGCNDGVEAYCSQASPACDLSKCQAVSTATGGCEQLATNPPDGPWSFRMRRIIIAAPKALASTTVQNSVVTNGVDMGEPQCGEEGTGDFSWIMTLDPKTLAFKTGGAPPCDIQNPTAQSPYPTCNPFTTGYCFLQQQVGSIAVGPITGTLQKAADGTYYAPAPTLGAQINIPIFYTGSIIVLPISQPMVGGIDVSNQGNCIGSFNPEALTSLCADSYENCPKWNNAGSLGGYITLETADSVDVSLLSKTLCVILTQSGGVLPSDGGSIYQCARNPDGSIAFKGDYCSTTNSPGGCEDSFWLAAAFSASAVNISGDCAGGSPSSSGGSSSGGEGDGG